MNESHVSTALSLDHLIIKTASLQYKEHLCARMLALFLRLGICPFSKPPPLCACVFVCGCVLVYLCVCRSEVSLSSIFKNTLPLLRQGLWLDWLVSKPKGSSCLHLAGSGITSTCYCHAWHFCVCLASTLPSKLSFKHIFLFKSKILENYLSCINF